MASGEIVTFTGTFHNGTAEPMDYPVPWCGGAASAYVSVALPQEPNGRAWTGIAQTFKKYVLTQAYGSGGVPALEPVRVDVRAKPCKDGQFEAMIGPGESITTSMSWKAEIVAGVEALGGTIPYTVSAGYDRQNGPPSYPPDYQGPRGSWSPMYKQLAVTGTIEVAGAGPALAGPGEVVDAVLRDRKFARWLRAEPTTTWSNANLFLTSQPASVGIMPAGPAWELDLFREVGVPRHWAIAFIDPFKSELISVTYCDVPCDR